jgi:hypothetical protein
MDYLIVVLITAMWLVSVIGAYAAGWTSGYEKSEENRRWDRWLLRHHGNRSIKF